MKRIWTAMVAACVVGSMLAAPATAAELKKVRVSTISSIDSAALEAARAQGYFAAEGLDIDTTPMVGGAAGLPALAAGQVQIASSNIVSVILGARQGLDFQIVVGGDATRDVPPDLAGLVVKPGSGIKSGKDLEGKKVAVNTRNNVIWLYARAWVKKTGGNPDKVTYMEVPFPQMVDAVHLGNVDAAFVVEPFLSAGQKAGTVELAGWPYSGVHKRIPISEYVSTKSFIEANPDVIARFVRAYNKGVDWVNANQGTQPWFDLISSYTRLPPEKVKDLTPPLFLKTLQNAQIEQVVALMRENGMVKGNFDVNSILHDSVREANK